MGELQDRINETNAMTDADKARNILAQLENYIMQITLQQFDRALDQIEDESIKENVRSALRAIENPYTPFGEAWYQQLRSNVNRKEQITKYLLMRLDNG